MSLGPSGLRGSLLGQHAHRKSVTTEGTFHICDHPASFKWPFQIQRNSQIESTIQGSSLPWLQGAAVWPISASEMEVWDPGLGREKERMFVWCHSISDTLAGAAPGSGWWSWPCSFYAWLSGPPSIQYPFKNPCSAETKNFGATSLLSWWLRTDCSHHCLLSSPGHLTLPQPAWESGMSFSSLLSYRLWEVVVTGPAWPSVSSK